MLWPFPPPLEPWLVDLPCVPDFPCVPALPCVPDLLCVPDLPWLFELLLEVVTVELVVVCFFGLCDFGDAVVVTAAVVDDVVLVVEAVVVGVVGAHAPIESPWFKWA